MTQEPPAWDGDADRSDKIVRVSQRRQLACHECTRRKIKCDKNIPCSRCVKLGHDCTRKITRLSKLVSKHRSEIQFLEQMARQVVLDGIAPTTPSVEMLKRRLESLQYGIEVDQDPSSASSSGLVETSHAALEGFPSLLDKSPIRKGVLDKQAGSEEIAEQTATVITILENLGWGRHYGSCYPHTNCSCHTHRSKSEMISINSNGTRYPKSDESVPSLTGAAGMPELGMAKRLVEFHINHVAWHHNALHSPTFLDQCERFWKSGSCHQPLWMALYLSVLSTSIWCAQNSIKFRATLDLEFDESIVPNLFRAMTNLLYAENFLENLSMYSIQAIIISTEVAHNLGLSTFNATLFSAAARIAQCLGLHKIADPPPSEITTTDQWHERVEREIGKRVWCLLLIQDHFSIPFTDSSCIQTSQYSTALPLNCDDYDLEEKNIHTPTISSYTRILVQIAALIPPLVDNLGPLGDRKPQHEQYQSVIMVDRQMRKLVGEIPVFLLRENLEESEIYPWLNVARRSLAITAADKIIMIHRPFLFESFQHPIYAYTRRTCVAAARTILREHEKITIEDEISIWTHSAFCITAAIVLGLEILHSEDVGDLELDREIILSARHRLGARRGDVMADRAANLIDAILHTKYGNQEISQEQQSGGCWPVSPTKTIIDLEHIVADFLTLEESASRQTNDGFMGKEQQVAWEEQGLVFSLDKEFDLWFSQTFGDEIS